MILRVEKALTSLSSTLSGTDSIKALKSSGFSKKFPFSSHDERIKKHKDD
jgi:hypothetical protein